MPFCVHFQLTGYSAWKVANCAPPWLLPRVGHFMPLHIIHINRWKVALTTWLVTDHFPIYKERAYKIWNHWQHKPWQRVFLRAMKALYHNSWPCSPALRSEIFLQYFYACWLSPHIIDFFCFNDQSCSTSGYSFLNGHCCCFISVVMTDERTWNSEEYHYSTRLLFWIIWAFAAKCLFWHK